MLGRAQGFLARAYRLLALAFDHPAPELAAALADGRLRAVLWQAQDALGIERSRVPASRITHAELARAHLALFEVSDGHAPCVSLRAMDHLPAEETCGDDAGTKITMFEDCMRFYRHFGLRLANSDAASVLPDHLTCQLEMLAFLCHCARRERGDSEAARGYLQAQHDFIARHPGRWLPRLAAMLRGRSGATAVALYGALAEAATTTVLGHGHALRERCVQ